VANATACHKGTKSRRVTKRTLIIKVTTIHKYLLKKPHTLFPNSYQNSYQIKKGSTQTYRLNAAFLK
jgi:hypothetical protein